MLSTSEDTYATVVSERVWWNAVRLGFKALRAEAAPAVCLNLLAALVVATYYSSHSMRVFWEWVYDIRVETGLTYGVTSTAVFAGLIPYLVRNARLAAGKRETLGTLVFWLFRWGFVGLELDLFYRAQAWLFGDSNEPSVVAAKVAVDMWVFLPVWGIPFFTFTVNWREEGYRLAPALRRISLSWYRDRVLPLLVSAWIVWLPAMTLIYTLPLPLQLPVENLVLCFYSLLLIFLVSSSQDTTVHDTSAPVHLQPNESELG